MNDPSQHFLQSWYHVFCFLFIFFDPGHLLVILNPRLNLNLSMEYQR